MGYGTQTTEQEVRQDDPTDHHRLHSAPPMPLGRLQHQRFLRAERMSNQPYQNILHFLNAHVHMLNHSSVQHTRRHIPPTTFLLQGVETLEDDTFPLGEPVSNVWQIVARITGRHMKVSPHRVYLEYRAKYCG